MRIKELADNPQPLVPLAPRPFVLKIIPLTPNPLILLTPCSCCRRGQPDDKR
jgi:hypothetical protein